MESRKSKDLVKPCPGEIAIPIVVSGQGSDTSMTSESGSYSSFSNTTTQSEKASNGTSMKHSESLRRRPSSRITEADSTQNELQIRGPSVGNITYAQLKSRVMEVEPLSPPRSNLARQSSGLGALSSLSKTSLSRRVESLKPGALPPAHVHDEDDDDRNEDEEDEDDEDDDDGDDDKKKKKNEQKSPPQKPKKRGKITLKAINVILEWIIFVVVIALLVASLYVHKLKTHVVWGLEIWKWCVLAAVFLCGRLVTGWAKDLIVFLIESKFLFNEKVVYFIHGVKQSVRVVIWLALVFLAWFLLIDRGVQRSRKTTRILNYITKALGATLLGAVMWMIKTLLVKLIAASFHVKTFFSKIREAIFHEYVLYILSVPPSNNSTENVGSDGLCTRWCPKIPKLREDSKENKRKEEITIKKLGKMKPGKMPVSTMGHLIDRIRSSNLSIISSALNDSPGDGGQQREITSRTEVEEAAYQIFHNVKSPNNDYIEEKDLKDFEDKENKDCLNEWFKKVADVDGKISEAALTNWAVDIYKEREYLSLSLRDAKTAIEELNRILCGIVLVLIVIVWLLLMGLVTTKVLVFLSSQLLVAVFIFGNTCKTVFEAMIFVFIMHPFDVGDRCVIDGVQMIVDEMDILKTTFLRYDQEKMYYPNSVLATKAISNFNRSPEMGDSVNFDIDVSISRETIQSLRAKIKEYIEGNSEYWHSRHSVQIKEIENMNKMKMVLFINHKMNFQDFLEKMNRRTELIIALKEILENLGIKYHLLPQEVHIGYTGSAVPATSTPAMPSRSVL